MYFGTLAGFSAKLERPQTGIQFRTELLLQSRRLFRSRFGTLSTVARPYERSERATVDRVGRGRSADGLPEP